jgi:LuxR family transcriptional regulator, maltose regulon positive regulatory protein
VLTALGACPAVPVGNPLNELALPGRPSRDPEFLAAVVEAIGAVPVGVSLVLDDVHELTAPDPVHGLVSLVRDRPPGLHLVLSGRTDPPLPLARMRLGGRLCEIRAERLRFSVPEADAMLARADVPARPDQVRLLVEETDGWAAGLRLAALSLREAEDADGFLAGFVGSGRAVSDYLVGEILSRLPDGSRGLLGAISVCDRLSAPLAAALSGRPDAGAELDSLERETSLVLTMGVDRSWYRVHPLLRSHLRADLQRQRPDPVGALHARAADWFAAADQPVPALAHARQSGDPERVARLVRVHAIGLVADGEHEVVRGALRELGDARVGGDCRLALVAATVATESGALAVADDHLAQAESGWPPDPPAELVALRALVRSRRAVVAGEPAGPGAGADADGLGAGPMAMLHHAIGLLGEGRRDRAREVAETALGEARREHHGYVVALGLTLLAVVAAADGDYRLMTARAAAADAELPDSAWRTTIGATWSSTMRAYGALLRCEPSVCLVQAAADTTVGGSVPPLTAQLVVLRGVLRGAALVDLGRSGEGLDELRGARSVAGGRTGGAEVCATAAVLEHRAAAQLGRIDVARRVLAWAEDELGPVGEVPLLRARHLAALGRDAAATKMLGPVLDGSAPVVLPWTLVEGRVLECRLAMRAGRRPQARSELDRALALAETMDVLRPLATGPPEVLDLLTRHLGSFGDREPTALRVLAARNALGADARPVALTERERAVLGMLPTQRSFDEIAFDLTVSHSTVKTHVRALYGKLGVNSRRDAVAVARRHGLLRADPGPGTGAGFIRGPG